MNGSMSGQAIYESFANSDIRVLVAGVRGTAQLHKNYEDRTAGLARLIKTTARVWQGEAADAARSGSGPLVVGHARATPQISNVATSMQQQAEAFETAKNSVVPVPPTPEKPGFFDNMISLGYASAHYEQQIAAIQSANDRNVAVMAQYEAATRQNQAMLSEIPKALNPPEESGLTPPPANPSSGPSAIPLSGGGGQPGRSGQSLGGTAPPSSPPPAQPPAPPESPTADTGLGQTHAESAQPSPRVSLPDGGSPKPTPASNPVPLSEGPKPGLPLGSVGGGYRPGTGPGNGSAPGGPRGYGAGGSGEPGGRGGIGTRGPAMAEGTAGRAAAGRTGGPGSGVPLGSGARSQEQEDLEHRRPAFLVESDPDELFGSGEAAAPPVIGA